MQELKNLTSLLHGFGTISKLVVSVIPSLDMVSWEATMPGNEPQAQPQGQQHLVNYFLLKGSIKYF